MPGLIARYRHRQPLSKNKPGTYEASTTILHQPHRVVSLHRTALRNAAPGWSCLSNMATARPPISLVAYSQSVTARDERRRQDEVLDGEAGPRRDSPPPSDRRTRHRGRTMLDESETYDDRRRLRMRYRASRGASRDYGGVRGGTPERVKHIPRRRWRHGAGFQELRSRVRRKG